MPNLKSAKKALRQSNKKREHNLFWKRRIKAAMKKLEQSLKTNPENIDILKKEETTLQKVLDKAAKHNVIHENKAKRLKSRYAKKVTANDNTKSSPKPKTKSKSAKSK
ncbi:MAG: 30S ribosomal protein S20 [Patescibacteria group bacterium]